LDELFDEAEVALLTLEAEDSELKLDALDTEDDSLLKSPLTDELLEDDPIGSHLAMWYGVPCPQTTGIQAELELDIQDPVSQTSSREKVYNANKNKQQKSQAVLPLGSLSTN
jgi:hypothetical protein